MDAQRDPGDIERQIEDLVERYVDELIAGNEPDLEKMALELPDDAARGRFRAKALAQAYLVKQAEAAGGATVEVGPYLARLAGDAQRELFHEVLRDAELARARVPGELVPGMRLDGRYEIRRELGRGGMGVVYAAFDHDLEREVAIKVLRLVPGAGAADWTELFRREARTLARLDSRNIVTIHDAHQGERSYIVMDLVRGKDLLWILEEVRQQRTELGPRSEKSSEALRRAAGRRAGGDHGDLLGERSHARSVARIVRLIALTLEHAHGAGVIHRDLKPQNVMLVQGGEPVLLDFGLASWGQEGSEEGFRGTPEYMAPEQIERMRAGSDPRTDVYQLGLLLYEMLALRRAFARKSREELWPLFERIQNGTTEPLASVAAGVPRALVAIAARAMERDPERRYQTMRALREDLDRFLTRLPPKEVRLAPMVRAGMHVDHALHQPFTAVVGALGVAGLLFMRAPSWVPPVLAIIKAEGEQVAALKEGERIELSDFGVLGLDVKVDSPTWLYVFQLFGTSEEDRRAQFLRPVHPLTFEQYSAGEKPSEPSGIGLEPGRHQFVCAELSRPEAYEGLLVYATPDEDAALAEWQRTLLELQRAEGLDVPFEDALQHLSNLEQSLRSDPFGTAPVDERRRAVGKKVKGVLAAEKEGTIPRRYYFLHRVELHAGSGGDR